jgi:hypothetical protein
MGKKPSRRIRSRVIAASILSYGRDPQLLETRSWVLQTRGYSVLNLTSLEEMAALPPAPGVVLLLLCHTLLAEDALAATALATRVWPGIKHVSVAAETSRAPTGLLGQLLHTADGPAGLLGEVAAAIGAPVHPHATEPARPSPLEPAPASRS